MRSLASLPHLRQGLLVLRRGVPEAEAARARLAVPAPGAPAAAPPTGLVTEPMTTMLAEWATAEAAR